jgi:hypothetical protein
LVFEAPPAGAKSLRLELPAAVWGGAGAFKFLLPSSMIRTEAAPRGRLAPRGT